MSSFYRDPEAPRPNAPRRLGVTAILERGETILLERRADDPSGLWALVGGNVAEDETVLDALHREVREETGFELRSASLFGIFSDPSRIVAYPDGTVAGFVSIVFRAAPHGDDSPRPSDESAEMRFLPAHELDAAEIWPAHRPILMALRGGTAGVVVA